MTIEPQHKLEAARWATLPTDMVTPRTSEKKVSMAERRCDGPTGYRATQFHGKFSADVSVATHARVQFGH